MPEAGFLLEVIVILLAAVLAVPLFQQLGLGAVVGYLVAGAVIGPSGAGLVTEVETIDALAELGVVFLLFTVGLELPFERLRVLGAQMFALGVAQILVTGVAIAAVALLFGAAPLTAALIGGALALSSTAIVLRLLSDRGALTSRFGRSAFAVLLVQDLAVGPMLVCVFVLGRDDMPLSMALGFALLKMTVAVMAILGVGRIVMRHAVWPVARIRDPEIFAALTLFLVLATGMITMLAGLSMAFGAFLAGMLLAETRYRLQVAAEIQPFRGLLLGLFFMSVGMSVDLELTFEQAAPIASLVPGIILGKAALLALLGRLFRLPWSQAISLGILLSQGGEFAFVLFGAAHGEGLLPPATGQILIIAVALTMLITPALAQLGRRVAQRLERASVVGAEAMPQESSALSDHVVIAGFGRVGSAVAIKLRSAGVPFIALDLDPHRIAQARESGFPVFYGNATRPEVLAAVHVERARAVVVAVDDVRAALQLVTLLGYIFPDLKVYARAKDDAHAAELEAAGADTVIPELVATGIKLAGSILDDKD